MIYHKLRRQERLFITVLFIFHTYVGTILKQTQNKKIETFSENTNGRQSRRRRHIQYEGNKERDPAEFYEKPDHYNYLEHV